MTLKNNISFYDVLQIPGFANSRTTNPLIIFGNSPITVFLWKACSVSCFSVIKTAAFSGFLILTRTVLWLIQLPVYCRIHSNISENSEKLSKSFFEVQYG